MKSDSRLRALTSPFDLKGYRLRNRIVFAPVSTRMARTDGSVSEQMLAYYSDKAAGGVAVVVTETLHVDGIASKFAAVQPAVHHDRFIPGLSNLADEIKKAGAVAIAQIGHAGRQAAFAANDRIPVAPSRIPAGPTQECHELTTDEIAQIIMAFGQAALRAENAGFDGVEIHAGNGYLINEFLSPYTNRRDDEYGRTKELLLLRVVEEVWSRISSRLILGVRLGCGDFVEGGLKPEEAIRISLKLPGDRVCYIHTSAGTKESNDYSIQPIYQERALLKEIARDMRKLNSIPVILTGSVNDVSLAEELLEKGYADLVGMGRPLLADPNLPWKVMTAQSAAMRPCIRCNQGCLARVRQERTIRCSVNPKVGYEWRAPFPVFHPPRKRKVSVLVAGAGPAGITAAMRAKEMGCAVKLFEREDYIGGLLNTARFEDFKRDISDYLAYLIARLQDSDIQVSRSTAVDAELLEQEAPDVLIDATGSDSVMPPVPEGLGYGVESVRDVLMHLDRYHALKKIVILGGGSSGCELGYALALKGAEVTIVEQMSCILLDLDPVSALALKRLLSKTDAQILTNAKFVRFDSTGIVIDGKDRPLPADLTVVAMGSRRRKEFDGLLTGKKWMRGINYIAVGDANLVGKIYDAVHGSYWAVTSLLVKYHQHRQVG
jgi:2,4-dienoyl-CoA reductase-like NADH-dependent reductase (Old Yellow Enzyme family)/thioredoxin reductase